MIPKRRIVIFVCTALLLGLFVCFIDVSVYKGDRICGYCESREEFAETSYFVLGAAWHRDAIGDQKPSQFLIDFPEHHCEHFWTRFDGKRTPIWRGLLLRHGERQGSWASRSVIVARYGMNEGFRRGVNQLLEEGTLSRDRLLELAKINCMDGGKCSMDSEDPGDAALLALIEAPEGSGDPAPLKWEEIKRVLKEPGSVVERILNVYRPAVAETKRVRHPVTSAKPRIDLEITMWESNIPGLTILTTKTNKSIKKAEEGTVRLSYMEVNVDAYNEYLRSSGVAEGEFLQMTPESARLEFPNIEEDTINAEGTGTLEQALLEHGDDPMAYVHMRFVKGRLKAVSFGRDVESVRAVRENEK